MGLAMLVDVKEIKDKAILDVAVTPVKEAVAKGKITGAGSAGMAVAHYGSNNMIAFRYKLKTVPMKIAEKSFTAGGVDFPAGSFVIGPGADMAAVKAAVEQFGLTGASLAAMPTVALHDGDLPRVAIYSTSGNTQETGCARPPCRPVPDRARHGAPRRRVGLDDQRLLRPAPADQRGDREARAPGLLRLHGAHHPGQISGWSAHVGRAGGPGVSARAVSRRRRQRPQRADAGRGRNPQSPVRDRCAGRLQRKGTRRPVLEQPDLPVAEPCRVQHGVQRHAELERHGRGRGAGPARDHPGGPSVAWPLVGDTAPDLHDDPSI